MMGLVNILLDARGMLIANAQIYYNASMKVLEALDKMAYKIGCQLQQDMNQTHFIIEEKNVAFSVSRPMDINVMFVLAGKRGARSYALVSESLDQNDTSLQSAMKISSSVIEGREKNYITSINYQNNMLFLNKNELALVASGKVLPQQNNIGENGMVVHSNIFSVSVGNYSVNGLIDPVKIMFRNLSVLKDRDVCHFWDFTLGKLIEKLFDRSFVYPSNSIFFKNFDRFFIYYKKA